MYCHPENDFSLRWSEALSRAVGFYKHLVPPGLKTEPMFVKRALEIAPWQLGTYVLDAGRQESRPVVVAQWVTSVVPIRFAAIR